MNELALFAGAGGGILGGHLMGWRTVCAVERDAYAAQVLAQRQNDGAIPAFPIWSDVCSFDRRPWRGLVDVVSGGFPCQDISAAGNGTGIDGARSGLWSEMARIVGEVRPRFVFVENSPLLVGRGLAVVLGDLAEMGYDAQWCIVSASDVGAPHKRDRCWIVANSNGSWEPCAAEKQCGLGPEQCGEAMADADKVGRIGRAWPPRQIGRSESENCGFEKLPDTTSVRFQQVEQPVLGGAQSQRAASQAEHGSFTTGRPGWPVEPGMGRVADGVAHRVDRIKALGNGQVPRVAATAFNIMRGKDQ